MNQLSNIPDPGPDIIDQLRLDYSNLVETVDAYDAEAAALPPQIRDDDERHRFADVISRMQKTAKTIENARTAEKAPYMASERAVDGFFFAVARKLNEVVDDLQNCLTSYLNQLREQERARQQAEAAEARRKAQEAEQAAAAARAQARDEERASARRRADEEAARKSQEADRHTITAMAAEQAAEARPAEVVRGRSESGKLSTLRTTWSFEILDGEEPENFVDIDLEKLRPYLARAHIEQAIRGFIKFGGRDLAGVRIFETTSAQVRG